MSENQSTIRARGLEIKSDRSRVLFRELNLELKRDRVALIGRNGSGKSTLLEVLAGTELPSKGRVHRTANTIMVRQRIDREALAADLFARKTEPDFSRALENELTSHGWTELAELSRNESELECLSLGQLRVLALVRTKLVNPSLVLLDEPSQHLDQVAMAWLLTWLESYAGGLVVVSHTRSVLEHFRDFFLVAESGCRLFQGNLNELENELEHREEREQLRYIRNLQRLEQQELRSATTESRRRRKRNLGRLHEISRTPSRAKLNENRSYAQESQGRRGKQRRARLAAIRQWTKESRRALAVELPLEITFPELKPDSHEPILEFGDVSLSRGGRKLFSELSLRLGRDRVAVVGGNGSGKTSLIKMALGQLDPTSGWIRIRHNRVGFVSQTADEWACRESLDEMLSSAGLEPDERAERFAAHRLPAALASRPMLTLSPGERLRAALVQLSTRMPDIEFLVLDEPTAHLDFLGKSSLRAVLSAWTGGLLLATHDCELLDAVRLDWQIDLDNRSCG